MKKIVILILIFLIAFFVYAGNIEQDTYCPVALKQHWVYSFYSKKEKKQKDDIHTYVNKMEIYDGAAYYDYETPVRSMHYLVAKTDSGVFLKAAKLNLPVLGFIGVDVVFDPPAVVLKFPFKKGDTWSYDGTVHVRLLAFIDIDRKVSAEFTQMGQEEIVVSGRKIRAYHLRGHVSRKWDVDKPVSGDYWLGENTGIVKGETKNSRMELKTYTLEKSP
jgi:hypothetical protein